MSCGQQGWETLAVTGSGAAHISSVWRHHNWHCIYLLNNVNVWENAVAERDRASTGHWGGMGGTRPRCQAASSHHPPSIHPIPPSCPLLLLTRGPRQLLTAHLRQKTNREFAVENTAKPTVCLSFLFSQYFPICKLSVFLEILYFPHLKGWIIIICV